MTQTFKTQNTKEAPNRGRFQVVPYDEETGNRPAEPEEFNSVEEAESFLEKTKERWGGWKSVQIVDKQTGKVVDVW